MLDRMSVGEIPRKHHIALKGPDGALRYEECLTREGFDGPYTILYHLHRPHLQTAARAEGGWSAPVAATPRPLAKRHFRTQQAKSPGGAPSAARYALLFNDDVVVSAAWPDRDDPVYFQNGDADDLIYVHQGGGTLRSPFGELRFSEGDYVCVPRGVLHRILPEPGKKQHWLVTECLGGLSLLKQWRNAVGQLRMDAPYSHRDFRRPEFRGPLDEGIRKILVKRNHAFSGYTVPESPLDAVGWDGTVYPWAFPILSFQPRVGLVHLPPTWHGTFAARGALICSFVPRPVDFHPEAVPCPYPHSSVDCDEILFYCRGNFTSRKGVGPGSVSLHPAGIPHGPHPGAYEASVGTKTTDELAVMIDTFKPLSVTPFALELEDGAYMESFRG
jgi:homogentisate 1,2-dioxygenase